MDQSFKNLFAGNEERFLTFTGNEQRDGGKLVPDYRTINRGVSDQDWARHLIGDVSLGLSPLRGGMVKWGAIDVDIYPVIETDEELEALMKAWQDPCLVARSKSGGIHIVAFSRDWIPAERMRKYLEAKRDAVLSAEVIEHAQEVFPKQTAGNGSQMNLPAFGNQRQVLAWRSPSVVAYVSDEHPVQWDQVEAECHVSEGVMADTVLSALTPKPKPKSRRTRERKKSFGGFKRPTDGQAMEGRNSFLYHVGASARSRGADNDQLEEIVRSVNDEFADPDSEFGNRGPLEERELVRVIQQVKNLPEEAPLDMSYEVVERMNEEWALLVVDGKLEFLNLDNGMTFTRADFTTYTRPKTVMVNGKRVPMSELWISDPDRAEYLGIVIESPEYDGPGWNVFQGWAVEPKAGDASLWVDYVERILCGGDKALAHWVMSWVADGVQRPWSLHPGTALALRGDQGGGKSFLGKMMARLLLPAQTQEIADSDRMFERFNRRLFGATFVLAEESVFTGSTKQANQLKVFITSNLWTYEQKHLATFDGKNVHRLIATTNDEQAVHLDDDDRRWTVIEVETMFDDMTSDEARKYWQPYYDIDPGIVLRYLLEYEVDQDLISRPHLTQAKRDDKIMSDPVLEVLHEIATSGIVPDDLDGRGKLATATLHREARTLGASPYDKPVILGNRARKILGWKGTCRDATHIKEYQRTVDGEGLPTMHPVLDNGGCSRGIDLKSLAEFRAAVSRKTGIEYGEGEWKRFRIPETNMVVPDPAAVEAAFEKREREKHGEGVPF